MEPIDTKDAISTLQAMKATIQGSATGLQSQADAITVALGILDGTLTTQLAELEAAKAEIANATP